MSTMSIHAPLPSTPLGPSLQSLKASLNLLDSTLTRLEDATSDFPRLSKVLTHNKMFTLISEPELRAAQSSILNHLVPEFETLVRRAESEVARLARKERTLISRRELVRGRLEGARKGSERRAGGVAAGAKASAANKERWERLKEQERRLKFEISKLELEAGQKRREMRKSGVFGIVRLGQNYEDEDEIMVD